VSQAGHGGAAGAVEVALPVGVDEVNPVAFDGDGELRIEAMTV
jgi:hypothetical protein